MPVNSQHWLGEYFADMPELSLQHLRIDSRQVQPGDVFVALAGTQTHGQQYIEQALAQGAALVLTAAGTFTQPQVYVLPGLAEQLPQLAARFYGQPAQHLTLIGVTGTNGKSSVTSFIAQIAQQLAIPSAVIGTLGYGRGPTLTPLANTTPHFVDIQRILADLLAQGVRLVAMEVSSHALVQQRVAGLHFAAAVFTNLSRDHLDYHGTMQAYAAAKGLLFTPALSAIAILNMSDTVGRDYAAHSQLPVYGYAKAGDGSGDKVLHYHTVAATAAGIQCQLSTGQGDLPLQLPLLGEFNLQNALAAIQCLRALGQPLPALIAAAALLQPVAGRMEQYSLASGAIVVVDYAHTPDALRQTLLALRQHCSNHLWCVFGCGGDRDKGKRPLMGQLAEQLADHLILTSDNPRTESPMAILEDIRAGLSPQANYMLEPDRKQAIKLALIQAHAGDVVLIAGKGHETEQIIGHTAHHYDERDYVHQLQQELAK